MKPIKHPVSILLLVAIISWFCLKAEHHGGQLLTLGLTLSIFFGTLALRKKSPTAEPAEEQRLSQA